MWLDGHDERRFVTAAMADGTRREEFSGLLGDQGVAENRGNQWYTGGLLDLLGGGGEYSGVAAVAVDDQEPFEPVGGEGTHDVLQERDQRRGAEGDRAGKFKVVPGDAPWDGGRDSHARSGDGRGRLTEGFGTYGVGRDGDVRPVLLMGPNRNQDQFDTRQQFARFRRGEVSQKQRRLSRRGYFGHAGVSFLSNTILPVVRRGYGVATRGQEPGVCLLR